MTTTEYCLDSIFFYSPFHWATVDDYFNFSTYSYFYLFIFFLQKLKYWSTMISPVILYYLIGLILKSNLVYISKFATIVTMCILLFVCRRFVFTSNFTLDFPLAVYLATKVNNFR